MVFPKFSRGNRSTKRKNTIYPMEIHLRVIEGNDLFLAPV